jgi:maleate cis-trans isomerase
MNSKTKNGIKPEKEIENRIANQQDLSDSTETIAGSTHNYISKKDSLELNTIQRIAIQTPYIIHTQNGIELFLKIKCISQSRI